MHRWLSTRFEPHLVFSHHISLHWLFRLQASFLLWKRSINSKFDHKKSRLKILIVVDTWVLICLGVLLKTRGRLSARCSCNYESLVLAWKRPCPFFCVEAPIVQKSGGPRCWMTMFHFALAASVNLKGRKIILFDHRRLHLMILEEPYY